MVTAFPVPYPHTYSMKPAVRRRKAMRARILFIFLFVISIVTSCGRGENTPNKEGAVKPDYDFTVFTERLFASQVCSDSLSLNYTLSHPENYNLPALPDGFSSFTYEDLAAESLNIENTFAALKEFSPRSLSREQQILYDILCDTLETRIEGQNFLSFTENLGPTTGIQAQLPVLLAEFRIEDRSDLSQYFALLKTTPDYFSSLLSLEMKKKELGTLPCRSTISHIINQCELYLGENGTVVLESSFEKKAAGLSFLNEKERKKAIKRNQRLVRKKVIPAYQTLMSGLVDLLPFAGDDGALCRRERGKQYYEYLMRSVTGSARPVAEIKSLLTNKLESARQMLISIAKKAPSLFGTCQDYAAKYTSTEQILSTLKQAAAADFPACEDTSYTVKYVDKALEDYLSPAFYLTPPIDDAENNIIYINGADRYDPASLFNTLAHEGYPGHLLQTCYMQKKNLPLLRYTLDYGGYTEGWASYAEIYSFRYTGGSEGEVQILQNNMISSLCLYGLADIGVHYEGWDVGNLYQFLKAYGTWEMETVTELYEAIIDEPASYLKYAVGYLEFTLLQEKFREQAGESYTDKNFHTYVLDMGSAPFSVLQKYIPQ